MIKNSILGKLCPVFHLWSAAVASRQNLNHGWCGRGSFLCATVKRSTPWWGGAILRVGEPRGRGRGGAHCCRKLYNQHKSLVPYCFSLSPSFPLFPPISITFSPSSFSLPRLYISLPSFCDPRLLPPGISALYLSWLSLHRGLH